MAAFPGIRLTVEGDIALSNKGGLMPDAPRPTLDGLVFAIDKSLAIVKARLPALEKYGLDLGKELALRNSLNRIGELVEKVQKRPPVELRDFVLVKDRLQSILEQIQSLPNAIAELSNEGTMPLVDDVIFLMWAAHLGADVPEELKYTTLDPKGPKGTLS